MDRLEFRFKTGNAVVDTLLNMKYHEITHAVPDLQMDVEGLQFPKELSIQSYDIGIILGNALDNAMEACRKLKEREPDAEAFIRISSFQKRELFFLKVENSFTIEMFALCNYADVKGIGTGGTFGSWHTLNYYRDNAIHNGYFELPGGTDSFKSVKQDWMKMVQLMMKDYMEAGLFKQALDGKGLLEIFER